MSPSSSGQSRTPPSQGGNIRSNRMGDAKMNGGSRGYMWGKSQGRNIVAQVVDSRTKSSVSRLVFNRGRESFAGRKKVFDCNQTHRSLPDPCGHQREAGDADVSDSGVCHTSFQIVACLTFTSPSSSGQGRTLDSQSGNLGSNPRGDARKVGQPDSQ